MAALARQRWGLDWILSPVSVDEFVRTCWEQRPLLVPRDDVAYFAGLLDLNDVEALITATSAGSARSAQDGRIVRTDADGTVSERPVRLDGAGIPDIQDIYRSYHRGYTVVVNRLHCRSAVVSRLCGELEAALHHPVGVNLYLTPAGAQGFHAHVDDHDVFILQVHGTKEWHVANVPEEPGGRRGPVRIPADYQKVTLTPGDTYYLPRGFPHEAVTSDSSSLHLTVGIHVHTWADVVVEAVRLLAERRPELRQALPPGHLDGPLDYAALARLADDLAGALSDPALAEPAVAKLASRLLAARRAAGTGLFSSLDAIDALTVDTVVERVPGMLCRIRSTDTDVVMEFPGNFVSGPPLLEPAFRLVADRERFTAAELPGSLSSQDRIDIVGRLISEGLLRCIPPEGGEIE